VYAIGVHQIPPEEAASMITSGINKKTAPFYLEKQHAFS